MESAGARLKKIRQEKGFSLEEISKKTKVHLNILKAIEEDTLLGLNPVYIKGFLKIYCKFLGQDAKEYITGYPEPPSPLKAVTKSASVKLDFLKAINIKIVFSIILFLFLLAGLFNLGRVISSPKGKIRTAGLIKPQTKITAVKDKNPGAPAPKKETLSIIRLGMRAKEDCWVNLKVDGRVVFRAVLKKGKFESWQAKERIEFSLGNAGVVELELNGRLIPPLGRRGQAVKNVSITKEEGLKVPR